MARSGGSSSTPTGRGASGHAAPPAARPGPPGQHDGRLQVPHRRPDDSGPRRNSPPSSSRRGHRVIGAAETTISRPPCTPAIRSNRARRAAGAQLVDDRARRRRPPPCRRSPRRATRTSSARTAEEFSDSTLALAADERVDHQGLEPGDQIARRRLRAVRAYTSASLNAIRGVDRHGLPAAWPPYPARASPSTRPSTTSMMTRTISTACRRNHRPRQFPGRGTEDLRRGWADPLRVLDPVDERGDARLRHQPEPRAVLRGHPPEPRQPLVHRRDRRRAECPHRPLDALHRLRVHARVAAPARRATCRFPLATLSGCHESGGPPAAPRRSAAGRSKATPAGLAERLRHRQVELVLGDRLGRQ